LRLTPPASASFATNSAFVIAVPPRGHVVWRKKTGAPYAEASAPVNVLRIYQGLALRRVLSAAADAGQRVDTDRGVERVRRPPF